jgi:NADPH-dependent 2,4-dienoyl-CoA reductase/sulfur reductase-like enzyme
VRVTKPGITDAPEDATITFGGRPVPARTGESVAAALTAAGHYALRRTRRTGERGIFCGMGSCSDCAVQIDGDAGRLACMEKVVPGLEIEPNPAARRIDASSPVTAPPGPLEELLETDVLVVGAGPAGLRAALAAARAGARTTVVDERSEAGGQYFKQPAGRLALAVDEPALDPQYRAGRRLLDDVRESSVPLLPGTRVWGSSSPGELYAASGERRYVLRCQALVLATGAFERGLPFPGWTLPGVMTTGAAQTLLRSYLVAAGARVLVGGNGPLNFQVAAELAAAGVKVVALVEAASLFRPANVLYLARMGAAAPHYSAEGLSYLGALARGRVPILSRSAVVEVVGTGRAEVATVARLDATGRPVRSGLRDFEVDAVCLGLGFVPSSELARSLGCEHRLDERTGALVVARDRYGRTSVDGVWVVGDGGGIGGAQVAQAMGTLAGIDAARSVGRASNGALVEERHLAEKELERSLRFQRSLWRLYASPPLLDQFATESTVICRCEEVTRAQLESAAEPWLAAAGSLKRATRAGMGKCQGRYCSAVLVAIAARRSSQPVGPYSGFIPQAPVTPVRASAIAAPRVSGPTGSGPTGFEPAGFGHEDLGQPI